MHLRLRFLEEFSQIVAVRPYRLGETQLFDVGRYSNRPQSIGLVLGRSRRKFPESGSHLGQFSARAEALSLAL